MDDGPSPASRDRAPAVEVVEQQVARVAAVVLHAWSLAERSVAASEGDGRAQAARRTRQDRLLSAVGRGRVALRDLVDDGSSRAGARTADAGGRD